MEDRKAAHALNKDEINSTWEKIVAAKSMEHSGDDLWRSIIESSQKSRPSVDAQFNFIGDRYP